MDLGISDRPLKWRNLLFELKLLIEFFEEWSVNVMTLFELLPLLLLGIFLAVKDKFK